MPDNRQSFTSDLYFIICFGLFFLFSLMFSLLAQLAAGLAYSKVLTTGTHHVPVYY